MFRLASNLGGSRHRLSTHGRQFAGQAARPQTVGLRPIRLATRALFLTVGVAVTTLCIRASILAALEVGTRPLVLSAGVAQHSSLLSQDDSAILTPGRLFRRAVWLLWSLSSALLLAPLACLSRSFCERVYYQIIYDAIVYSRSAALTKWAQWASVRLDLLPVSLCTLLSRLQTSAPTHSFAETLSELEALGLPVMPEPSGHADALSDLETKPLASGSIAQVYRASFHDQKVAVKVRHPCVDQELLLDFELLRRVAHAIHHCVPPLRWLNAPSTVSQFEAAMSGQCDLSQEARHLEMFSYNFRRKSSWVTYPKVFLATPTVLIESFESGVLATDFVKQTGLDMDRSEAHFLIARGEDIYLQMLLVDNFMHADLHPGNMIYRKAGLLGKPQLVLLDAGMAAALSTHERRNFIGLLQAFGDGNGAEVAERVLEFSMRPSFQRNVLGFKTDIQAMCEGNCRGYGTGVDLGVVLREMMQLMYRHGVSIDGNYATLIANMLCLEGLSRQLEPRFNVLDAAYPFLRGHQLLGDKSFQQLFHFAQWFLPLPVWECGYRIALHGAMHGGALKRFQI